jgi:uncharacterized protein YjiS (DUF1127 family)
MATIGLSGGFAANLGTWIRNAGRDLNEEMQRRRVYRKTFAELDGLSDRDLGDIGVSRTQIGDIARDAAYGSNRWS